MAAFSYGIMHTISHKLRQVEAVEKVVVISKFHPCFLQHVTAVIAHSRKSWNLTAKSEMHPQIPLHAPVSVQTRIWCEPDVVLHQYPFGMLCGATAGATAPLQRRVRRLHSR